jgi:thioester reductase-like protein
MMDVPRGTHLVTGATGFIGGALVAELLQRTRDAIIVVIRGENDAAAEARFHAAFAVACRAYELGDDMRAEARRRVRVVAGDVTAPGLGVAGRADLTGPIDQFWHSAASLRYEDRYRVEIRNTNVEGTINALELASHLRARCFNYISTAYVAGTRIGAILEEPAGDVRTNNEYERSKCDAEALLATAPDGMRVRLMRPSVVIGHSRTRAATSFSGFYGALRQFAQFGGLLERMQAGLVQTSLRLAATDDVTINLIPIDRVVAELVDLAERDAPAGIYHLTNRRPPTVGAVVRRMFAELGFAAPVFSGEEREGFTYLERKLDQRLQFFRSYMGSEKRFDRARVDGALGDAVAPAVELDDAEITEYVRWYLDVLRAERASLPVAR